MYTAEKKKEVSAVIRVLFSVTLLVSNFRSILVSVHQLSLIASIIVSTHIRTKDHRLIIAQPAHRPITALASNSID